MGHSYGADAAIFMAEKIKTLGAPVALVVTFGPTGQILVAPSNVSQVINYYMGDKVVAKGPGFRGTISNIDLNWVPDINHLNVEKSSRLHASVFAQVLCPRWTRTSRTDHETRPSKPSGCGP